MPKAAPLSKVQYETLAAFRYALREFLHFSERAALTAGVTTQQHQALLAIKGFSGREQLAVGELAERLQLRHHSAVELVDRMVRQNLVVRLASPGDRRRVLIGLTARGERILHRLSATHRRQLRSIGPQLTRLLSRLNKANTPG